MEVAAARSSAGDILRERREEYAALPPPPAPITVAPLPPPAPVTVAPTVVPGPPPPPAVTIPPPPPPAAFVAPTPVVVDARPVSPATTSSSGGSSYYYPPHHHHERSAPIAVGPLALAERSRSRSRSRARRDIRAEIKALERELVHRPRHELGPVGEREIVAAERLPNGELVVYEEQVEKVIHHHKPPRVEKDKKGRLSLSLPRH